MDVHYELCLENYRLMYYADFISKTNQDVKYAVDAEIAKAQDAWDTGDSFLTENFTTQIFFGRIESWPKRKPEDDEKERNRLIENTAHRIFKIILRYWITTLQRDELSKSLNLFAKLDRNAEIKVFDTFSVPVLDMVGVWNETHDNTEQIYVQLAFEK